MSAVFFVIFSGIFGGLALAVVFSKIKRAPRPDRSDAFVSEHAPTDLINMAHIRVAGVGGLGLVVVALATAIDIPEIGRSIGLGLALGIIVALVLIFWRRRVGPMPSS